MKKHILFLFFTLLAYCAGAQITFSAPVVYTTGVPTGAPSGQGSRIRIDLLTGWLYEWSPVTTTWLKLGQGIDNTSGSVAPVYTPGIGQSWFAVNGANQLYRYSGTGTTWNCLNCTSTSVNSVNGLTGTVVLDLTLTGTTLSLTGDPTSVSFSGWDTNAADDFSGDWADLANIPAGFADGSDDGTTYTAGAGISISGLNVITNTGDTDAGDDVTSATSAGGDLSGTYPNPTVDGLQGVAVSATSPTSGQVLKYNGSAWAPGTDNSGSGGDNWGSQVVATTARLSGSGVSGNELDIAQQGATTGQVLKWNGTAWAPAADTDTDTQLSQEQVEDYAGGMVSGNTETGITVTYDDAAGKLNFVATDASATNEIQNLSLTGQALGISSGSGVTLPIIGVSAGTGVSVSVTSGNATITNTGDTDASNDVTTSTSAGGDLNGTYPNPTVDGLQGVAVSTTAPTSGQVLKYNGTAWAPGADTDTQLSQEQLEDYAGGMVSGNTETGITVTYDDTAGKLNFVATDASATNEIQNLSLTGQALGISSGSGVTLPIIGVSAGTGVSVSVTSGNATITNTGDTDASNDITTSTTAGGDLSGTYPNPTVDGLQGVAVSATSPTTGQVLKYNGTEWAPGTDATGGGGGGSSDALGTGFTSGGGSGSIPAGTVAQMQGGFDIDNQDANILRIGDVNGAGSNLRLEISPDGITLGDGDYVFGAIPGDDVMTLNSPGGTFFAGATGLEAFVKEAANSGFKITDNQVVKTGAYYAGDYSATLATNDRSIPDVGTVKLIIQSGQPQYTTTERDALSPSAGWTIYCTDCTANDSSTGVTQTYNGSAWKNHW